MNLVAYSKGSISTQPGHLCASWNVLQGEYTLTKNYKIYKFEA